MNNPNTYSESVKLAEEQKKANNYKELNIKCCLNCIHSSTLDDLTCNLIDVGKYSTNGVYELGFCDKYKKDL